MNKLSNRVYIRALIERRVKMTEKIFGPNPTPLKIMDTTLRDGHQSLLATRMKTEDMIPLAERMDEVGYWGV